MSVPFASLVERRAQEREEALLAVAEAARKLLAVTICRRFTVEFCWQRPELPQTEWCKTCVWRHELAGKLASLDARLGGNDEEEKP